MYSLSTAQSQTWLMILWQLHGLQADTRRAAMAGTGIGAPRS